MPHISLGIGLSIEMVQTSSIAGSFVVLHSTVGEPPVICDGYYFRVAVLRYINEVSYDTR